MTRFKELKRIELAIKNNNEKEIIWALKYCQTRLQISQRKEQIKYWKIQIDKLKLDINRDK